MKIIYISSLPKTMSGGPKYSVPKQVSAQAKYDEVYWINLSQWGVMDTPIPCENILNIHDAIERIISIAPDLVVYEDFYYFEFLKIAKSIRRNNIPYVIVPRGSITYAAQRQKWFKKIPANLIFFLPFSRKAAAIEFLTEKEKESSGVFWNNRSIIIPNGTTLPSKHARPSFSKAHLQGTFIGRINLYHKGLDIFFDVCEQLKPMLIDKKCKMDFYGPYPADVGEAVQSDIVNRGLASIIRIHKEVHGKEKEEILLNSDFFILTSRFEGMPMGLLEALSYGLPAIVTHETNIGEIIEEAGAGFSSKCEYSGIRNSMERLLLLNDGELNNMSYNAIGFSKLFDWYEIAKKAHDEYTSIVKEEL